VKKKSGMILPRVPKTSCGQFGFFFAAELVCFFIIVANMRAVALANYLGAASTDLLFGLQAWGMMKLTVEHAEARTFAGGIGTTLGGVCGTLLSIWCTKRMFGR
jgi:hypothetical protein